VSARHGLPYSLFDELRAVHRRSRRGVRVVEQGLLVASGVNVRTHGSSEGRSGARLPACDERVLRPAPLSPRVPESLAVELPSGYEGSDVEVLLGMLDERGRR